MISQWSNKQSPRVWSSRQRKRGNLGTIFAWWALGLDSICFVLLVCKAGASKWNQPTSWSVFLPGSASLQLDDCCQLYHWAAPLIWCWDLVLGFWLIELIDWNKPTTIELATAPKKKECLFLGSHESDQKNKKMMISRLPLATKSNYNR